MNPAFSRRGLRIAAAILLLFPCVSAESSPAPDIPVADWLNAPEHSDFSWKVQILGPWLGFQQRHVAGVRVTLPVRKLIQAGISLSDLHLSVKLADGDGRWFPGQYDTDFIPPPDIAKGKEIRFYTRFYVQPARYVVAVLAYDSRNRRSNLWKGELRVPPLKQDPLPEAGRNLPALEFPGGKTPDSSSLAQAQLSLPVRNARPIQLDVVVNLALSDTTNTRYSQAPDWVYRTNANMLLQMAKVLSQLDLKDGCVRISAIDILRQEVFADRSSGTATDWDQLTHSVELLERRKIDIRVLEQQKATPALFARFLETAAADSAACSSSGGPPLHVLVVISDAFLFPFKTEMTAVRPELIPGTLCYYMQLNPVRGGTWDQIGRVLSPLHPRRWAFSSPLRFRKAVAELIAELETAPATLGAAPHAP